MSVCVDIQRVATVTGSFLLANTALNNFLHSKDSHHKQEANIAFYRSAPVLIKFFGIGCQHLNQLWKNWSIFNIILQCLNIGISFLLLVYLFVLI